MTSRRASTRFALALSTLCLVPLQGCLTAMLWAEDRSAPELAKTHALCRIHSVRGDFLAPGGTAVVEVDFSTHRDNQTPYEVEAFTENEPGRLRIREPGTEPNWFALPGAAMFRPRAFHFGVFRGTYFRNRSSSVQMIFSGGLSPAELGTVIAPEDVAPELRGLPPMDWQPGGRSTHSRILRSFVKRNWLNLIDGVIDFSERNPVPLAWLDGAGKVIDPTQVATRLDEAGFVVKSREELAGYTLLGRLDGGWGRPVYVRVPLPILVHGDKLTLRRVGPRILWRRTQVWKGQFTAASNEQPAPSEAPGIGFDLADDSGVGAQGNGLVSSLQSRPVLSVPIRKTHFIYTHAEEYEGGPVLWTLGKILLTPVTMVLDYAIRTSAVYIDVIRWLASGAHGGDRSWSGPVPDRKK